MARVDPFRTSIEDLREFEREAEELRQKLRDLHVDATRVGAERDLTQQELEQVERQLRFIRSAKGGGA